MVRLPLRRTGYFRGMTAAAFDRARRTLGDVRLEAFLQAVVDGTGPAVLPLRRVVDGLDNGLSLEQAIRSGTGGTTTAKGTLRVEQVSARTFRITCAHLGDQRTWRTSFRACGKVQRLVPEG